MNQQTAFSRKRSRTQRPLKIKRANVVRGMDKHFIEPVKRLRIERGNILKDAKLTGRSGVDAFRLNKRYAIFLVGVVEGHLPVNSQDAYFQIVECLG